MVQMLAMLTLVSRLVSQSALISKSTKIMRRWCQTSAVGASISDGGGGGASAKAPPIIIGSAHIIMASGCTSNWGGAAAADLRLLVRNPRKDELLSGTDSRTTLDRSRQAYHVDKPLD